MNLDNTEFESQLKKTLARFLFHDENQTPKNLAESIQYSLLSPGKRIRPRVTFACAEMLGLPSKTVLSAALALEMTHCFTLIHDDLPCMDNDDYRRGLLSNHKKFGEGLALLAGNGLMALAVDVLLDSPVEPTSLLLGIKQLIQAMGPRGVVGGQAAEALLTPSSTLEDLRKMHHQKTGALFKAALLIPKEFAGISDFTPLGQAILSFSDALGFAFQIADDLEDAQEKNQQTSPTSILSYLSPQKSAQLASDELTSTSHLLMEHWGSKAHSLKEISTEVLIKITHALGDFTG